MIRRIAVALAVLAYALLLRAGVQNKSATVDELSHLACGLYTLETFDFRLHRAAPPLQNLACALPARLFADPALSFGNQNWRMGIWNGTGDRLLEANPDTFHELLQWGRWGTIALSAALLVLIFVWTRQLWGDAAAWFALALAALEPNLAAHGRLATTDTAPTLLFLLTGYFLWRFARDPSRRRVLPMGAAFGLAWCSKHSGAVLLPAIGLALAVMALARPGALNRLIPAAWMPRIHPKLRGLAVALAVSLSAGAAGMVVIWAGYGFEIGDSIEGPVPPNRSHVWNAVELPAKTLLYMSGLQDRVRLDSADPNNPLWKPIRAWLPAFTHWEGFFANRAHIRSGHLGYFMGELSSRGWRSYYPVLFLVKTPVPLLIALFAGAALLAVRRAKLDVPAWLGLCTIPAVYLFVIVFMNTANIGYRHALPALPFALVLFGGALGREAGGAARALAGKWREGGAAGVLSSLRSPRERVSAMVSILALAAPVGCAVEMARIHPHYLSYFNALAGGPRNGDLCAVDSNLDWGQDLLYAKDYIVRRNIENPRLFYFGPESLPDAYGVPHSNAKRQDRLEPGLYIVSASLLRGIGAGTWHPKLEPLRQRPPDDWITPAMRVYRVE